MLVIQFVLNTAYSSLSPRLSLNCRFASFERCTEREKLLFAVTLGEWQH